METIQAVKRRKGEQTVPWVRENEYRKMLFLTRLLFDSEAIDRFFDTPRFIELFYLGWTPLRYVLADEPTLVGSWIDDADFVVIWRWWNIMHHKRRRQLLENRDDIEDELRINCGIIANPCFHYTYNG